MCGGCNRNSKKAELLPRLFVDRLDKFAQIQAKQSNISGINTYVIISSLSRHTLAKLNKMSKCAKDIELRFFGSSPLSPLHSQVHQRLTSAL